ncbi:MAG: hypothetical protein IPJ74_08845 [Saprospiraceae bacterium]|nr:hypothetical protein [Saprospiraceae bacterium]
MINQEEVYKWLSEEEYGKLIDLLHREKEAIKSDQNLIHAAKISVTEILRVSKGKEKSDEEFIFILEKLNMIHAGKFFKWKMSNTKS